MNRSISDDLGPPGDAHNSLTTLSIPFSSYWALSTTQSYTLRSLLTGFSFSFTFVVAVVAATSEGLLFGNFGASQLEDGDGYGGHSWRLAADQEKDHQIGELRQGARV